MKVKGHDMYLDGGTIEVCTDMGIYCIDSRIDTSTKGQLYLGYPKDDNSNLVLDQLPIKTMLLEGLSKYEKGGDIIDLIINSIK